MTIVVDRRIYFCDACSSPCALVNMWNRPKEGTKMPTRCPWEPVFREAAWKKADGMALTEDVEAAIGARYRMVE